MNFQKFSATIFPLLLALLLFGCAASQKMQAANILRQCKVEIIGASLDSINLDLEKIIGKDEKPLGGILPNPKQILLIQNIAKGNIPDSLGTLHFAFRANVKNPTIDTIWLRAAQGSAQLDSLVTLPLNYADSAIALSPGDSEIQMHSRLPIDKNILKIFTADTLKIQGELTFALSPDGDPISFSIHQRKIIQPEERTEIIDRVRTQILSTLTDSWASAFRP